MTLDALSKQMAKIDFAMLSTRTQGGAMASRPMSNNGDVEYRGDSYFFSYEQTQKVTDIQANAQVGLTFTGAAGLLGGPPLFIAVEGTAELIRTRPPSPRTGRRIWTSGSDRAWIRPGLC